MASPSRQSGDVYRVADLSTPAELNRLLERLTTRLNRLEGLNGTPRFYADVDMRGKSTVKNLPDPVDPRDAQIKALTLALDRSTGMFDAQGALIANVSPATEASQAVILEQLRSGLSGVNLSDEAFVVAVLSSALTAERLLSGEATVVTITDNGAGSTIVVSLTANGVTNAKLRQGIANTVIGRSANSTGNVADIQATTNKQVLILRTTTLTFDNLVMTDLTDVTSGNFTITGTGFAANPTATAIWEKHQDMVLLHIPSLTGTSNATTFTLTGLPAAIQPTKTAYSFVSAVDNGGAVTGLAILTAGSGTVGLFASPAGAIWTNSGTKTLNPCMLAYAMF